MEDEARGILGLALGNNSRVETFGIPLFEASRFTDGQIPLHGKICPRQEQGVFIGFTFWSAHSARSGTLGREGEKVKVVGKWGLTQSHGGAEILLRRHEK